jgi:hypothetical protein
MSAGWVKVERELLNHPVLCRKAEFDERSAFLWLIAEAAYKPVQKLVAGELVTLKEGQLCHSIRFMAKAWDWDLARVQRFLNRLKTNTMIDTEIFRGRMVLSVCNYRKYQRRFRVDHGAVDTATETKKIRLRYKLKTGKKKEESRAPAHSDSPEGVQGEVRNGHRHGREWSPKVNDPNQLDLITDTALAADEPVMAQAPEPAVEPEPELPLGLSLEAQVIPPEPEVMPPVGELFPAPPPAKPSNVVKLHPERDPDFREWYATYPRHKKPLDAAKAYAEARRRASASELLEGAHRCREEATGKEKRFVAYPASWLRAGGWMEEAEPECHAFEGNYHGRHDHREERGPNALPVVIASMLARRFGNAGPSGV